MGAITCVMHSSQHIVEGVVDQSGPFTHVDELVTFLGRQLLPPNRTPRLLDLCCGTGRTASAFASVGWDVLGVESSSDFAGAWSRISDDLPNCEFVVSDYFSVLLQARQKYDAIVAFDELALELAEDGNLAMAMTLMLRSLRRGGLFIFQLDRVGWRSDPVTTSLHAGFSKAWRASVVDPSIQIDASIAHRGSRDLFVARR